MIFEDAIENPNFPSLLIAIFLWVSISICWVVSIINIDKKKEKKKAIKWLEENPMEFDQKNCRTIPPVSARWWEDSKNE